MFREHLICFSNVKGITFHTFEFVHQVRGFPVSKNGDGIGQFGVRAWGGCGWGIFTAGTIGREGCFQGDEIWVEIVIGEDLAEVGWLTVGFFFF